MEMKNEFFYEFNCIEDGEWIPENQTFEDNLVMDLRFIWNHRYNLERRYSQQYLRSDVARWRFKRQQKNPVKGSFASFGHTAVIENLRPIFIKVWKIGIYRNAKNVWILLISLNGC